MKFPPISQVSSLQLFNLLRFGTTLLISVFLAKSGLPTADIALYEAFLFFTNMASFFWVAGGQNALLQLYPKGDDGHQKKTIFHVWVVFSGLSLLAAATLGLFWQPLFGLTNFDEAPPVFWLCLFIAFNTPAWLNHLFYLLWGQKNAILWYGMVTFGLQLAAVVLPLSVGMSLNAVFAALVGVAFLKFLWSVYLIARRGVVAWDGSLLRTYAALAFPLILHVFIGNSVEYVDGLIVAGYFEDSAFAIFRYGAKELPLTLLLVGAVVTALIPEVARDVEGGLKKIKSETARLSKWLFPLSAGLMLVSPWLFPMVFNPDFAASAPVFNVYLLIISSRILLPQVVLMAHGKNYYLVVSAIFETLLNIGLSLWWAQIFGLTGIAFATVVAYLFNKIVLIYFNHKHLGIPPGAYIDFRKYLVFNALLFGAYGISQWW
ncbi:MAG: hypothetical protein D6714_01925 [Bacteroidetes bacterium]|nr:MAG: hypothetical protein D6714_01925 [Bacteroidota bacterium]